jgi:hypothetical protein
MKRVFVLTILMVSIASFVMEGRTVYLVLITGCLSLILVSILNIGRLLATRTPVPASAPRTEVGIEHVRRA